MNPVSSSSCTRSIPGTAPTSTTGPLPPTPARPMTRVQTAPAHPIASGAASLARTAQVAPALRDRNADIAHSTEPLASRKRKREEAPLSPLEGDTESEQRDAKQARHAIAGREVPRTPRPAPDQGALPATPQTEPPTDIQATARQPSQPAVSTESTPAQTTEAQAVAEVESDHESDDTSTLVHGQYVSVYAGIPAATAGSTAQTDAESAVGTRLYEEAVFTDNNGMIAISTEAERGVFASDLSIEIGVIFSNATGVGCMVIGPPESEGAQEDFMQEDFMNARSEFIERTGSDQNIRIRIAHNAQGFRRHLDALWTAETLQTIRTALDLPTERTDAQIREGVTTVLIAQREPELRTMAAGWGSVDPLIDLPHGALHISQAGLDVFQAPPSFDLPAHLHEPSQRPQD